MIRHRCCCRRPEHLNHPRPTLLSLRLCPRHYHSHSHYHYQLYHHRSPFRSHRHLAWTSTQATAWKVCLQIRRHLDAFVLRQNQLWLSLPAAPLAIVPDGHLHLPFPRSSSDYHPPKSHLVPTPSQHGMHLQNPSRPLQRHQKHPNNGLSMHYSDLNPEAIRCIQTMMPAQ